MAEKEPDSEETAEASKEKEAGEAGEWPGPHTVTVHRTDDGFGFTLRHFIVYPPEGAAGPQIEEEEGDEEDVMYARHTTRGQQRKRKKLSALEPMDTIFVKQVKDGGPAYHAGLHTGDRIVSVNGESVTGKTYSQVIALIQASDASLRLLVVPKDEDILQMAYQNSAYNQGRDPYRGSATEIPRPPAANVYTQRSQSIPNEQSSVRSKPPFAPRYKSEIHVHQEEDPLRRPADTSAPMGFGSKVSTSSLGSLAADASGGPSSIQLAIRNKHLSYDGGSSLETESDCGGNYNPPLPARSSSHKVVISHLANLDHRGGSMDSLSKLSDSSANRRDKPHRSHDYMLNVRSSHENLGDRYDRTRGSGDNLSNLRHSRENLRHSSDNLITQSNGGQLSKSVTTGRLPSSSSTYTRPPPYTRSLTTSSLTDPSTSAAIVPEHSQTVSAAPPRGTSRVYTSNIQTESKPLDSRPVGVAHVRYPGNGHHGAYGAYPPQPASTAQPKYGAAFTVRLHEASGATSSEVPYYTQAHNRVPMPTSVTISAGRPSSGDQTHNINLVTERLKKYDRRYESSESPSPTESVGAWRRVPAPPPPPVRMGHDSVASRVAAFEVPDDNRIDDDNTPRSRKVSAEERHRKISIERQHAIDRHVARIGSPPQQTTPPQDIRKIPATPPATISIYFRSDQPSPQVATLQPSPERLLKPAPSYDYSDGSAAQKEMHKYEDRDRSPIVLRQQEDEFSPISSRRHKAALRQPSYLTAVNSPHSNAPVAPSASLHAHNEYEEDEQSGAAPYRYPPPLPPPSGAYMHHSFHGAPYQHDPELQVMPSSELATGSSTGPTTVTMTTAAGTTVIMREQTQSDEDRESKLVRRVSYLMATGREKATQLHVQHEMSKSDSHLQPPPPPASPSMTTPTKQSNIRKLKAFFGEKTPRIVETMADRSRVFDMPVAGEIRKEGALNCKMAITDGKRATDRSWKPFWAMLRGHALFLFKDRTTASASPTLTDEQPLSIKSSFVDIAYDYTKKKNVFRLTTYNGSEYLFQADDHESMIEWIRVIQANNNPDEDQEKGLGSQDLIIRKTTQYEQAAKFSPQAPHKSSKKLSKTSLRSKSPASHSPGAKQKKPDDHSDSPKSKDKDSKENRTWKGRMVKKLTKRYGSSSSAPVETETEVTGTFCVPLELCPPSSFNELVPQVVALCTQVVEDRGLENQGIYRVPGNTGAVNMLQEELNKDPYSVDIEADKWLDVNVVSSLLKSFFRKLPEPLITDELYDPIINANRWENPEKRMLRIKKLLHELPDHNFETFRFLAQHLNKVEEYGHSNKMYARNLAIVFGPTLLRTNEENLVSMVKDMTDQCRIVESIVLHYDWFFSSWDVDDHVPIDEEDPMAVPLSGMNQELRSMAEVLEYGDRGKDVSAKVIVSSIISAANRKIKKKDRNKSIDPGSAIEPEGVSTSSIGSEPPSYNERNIDREIELRRVKENTPQQQTTSTVLKESATSSSINSVKSAQGNTSISAKENTRMTVAMQESKNCQDREGVYSAKRVFVQRKDSESSIAASSTTSEESWSGTKFQVTKYPAYQPPEYHSYSTENSKPAILRRYSEDILSERRERDEFSGLRPSPSRGLTYQAQQHLRRLQMETQQLRQREEEQRIEQEKRAQAKHRIEMELQRTKQELEQEECIEDLLAKPTEIAARIVEYSSKYSDYGSKADSTSITSDYSTTSSTAAGYDGRSHHPVQQRPSNSSDYSSSASPSSVHIDHRTSSHTSNYDSVKPKPPPGGSKYFVMSSTVDTVTPQLYKHSARDDIDLYRGGHYSPFDTSRVAGRGTLSRKKQPAAGIVRRAIDFEDEPDQVLQRTGSMRRKGSLDSLLDYYDKNESHGYMSSDSEKDSEDLLQSLTATFDQKLKLLLDPKYQPATPRRLPPDGASSSPSTTPKMALVAPITHADRIRNVSDTMFNRPFPDPPPYRPRGDPKIGIASRFERKSNDADARLGSSSSSSMGSGSPTHNAAKADKHSGLVPQRGTSESSLSQDRSATSSEIEAPSRGSSEYKSKSEKTDANLLQKVRDSVQQGAGMSDHSYARALRKSSEILYGSAERILDYPQSPDSIPTSLSPPLKKRDPTEKRQVRRRHTVGGTNDVEHFRALMSISSPTVEKRESAWERLKPAVKDAETAEVRNIAGWLEQHRLHSVGSSPALFTEGALQPFRSDIPPPIPPRYHSPPHHQVSPPYQPRTALPSYEHDHRYSSSSGSEGRRSQSNSRKSSPTSPDTNYTQRTRAPTFTFESSI